MKSKTIYANNLKLRHTLDDMALKKYMGLENSLGLDHGSIIRRLQQILLMELLSVFWDNPGFDEKKFFYQNDNIAYQKNGDTFTCKVNSKVIVKNVIIFLKNSIQLFAYFFRFNPKTKDTYSIAELWAFENQTVSDLKHPNHFYNSGFLAEWAQSKVIVGLPHDRELGKVATSKNPLKYLAKKENRGMLAAASFFYEQTTIFFELFFQALKKQELFFLFPDLSYLALIKYFNRQGLLKNYAVSNSYFISQNLSIFALKDRKHATQLLFYSSNLKELQTKDTDDFADLPHCYYLFGDVAYCWNKELEHWIQVTNPQMKTKIVGTYLPWLNRQPTSAPHTHFTVILFDNPPLVKSILKKAIGRDEAYNSLTTAVSFLQDSINSIRELEVALGVKCEIKLKSKRKSPYLIAEYFDYIDTLKKVEIMDVEDDLFPIINSSNLCICIPFTSVAYIASSINIDSVYYDPTSKVELNILLDPKMSFASSQQELKTILASRMTSFKEQLLGK
ncbi:MAG: hypothetical protein ACOYL6_02830 [Bacteriovoracaceae bacterium]